MTEIFTIKEGDTSPSLRFALSPVVDLTGATARFSMRLRGQAVPVISEAVAAIIAPATDGVVQYAWLAGDTATPGDYEAEFEVTYADSTVETFPNAGYIQIMITGEIA